MATSPEMHITIVATGDHSPGFALAHEIELVKAAVLYADRVSWQWAGWSPLCRPVLANHPTGSPF